MQADVNGQISPEVKGYEEIHQRGGIKTWTNELSDLL